MKITHLNEQPEKTVWKHGDIFKLNGGLNGLRMIVKKNQSYYTIDLKNGVAQSEGYKTANELMEKMYTIDEVKPLQIHEIILEDRK